MSGINITIDGKEMSLEGYLQAEEKKRKKDFGEQASDQFAAHSGEFAYAAGVGQRKYHYSDPEPTGKKRVTYSKRYSTDEIKEEEMAESKKLRELLLRGFMKHQNQWVTTTDLAKTMNLDMTERKHKQRWHSAVAKMVQYLIEEQLAVRHKDPAGGRSHVYMFKAKVDDPDREIPILEGKYLQWMRNTAASLRALKRGETPAAPLATQVEEAPVITASAPVEVEKRDIERLVNLAQNATLTVLVKVEVRFGLLK